MAKIHAVTFDLAGTLLFPFPSVGGVYAAVAARHGITVSAADLEADFPLACKGAARGSKPMAFWREVVIRTFGPSLPATKAEVVFQECWEAFARPESWRMAPGTLQTLTALRFLGLKVAVLSNADSRMRAVLKGKDLLRYFDLIHLADETGYAKPEAKAFAHAARALQGTVATLVHVGDHPTEDGLGARDAGATGLVVGGAHAPERCLRAEKLLEVPYLIRALLTEGRQKGKFSRTVMNLLANLRGLPEDRARSSDRDMKTLDAAVLDAFKKLRLDKPVPETAIVAHWHELLPARLARRCAPLRVLEGGKLIIQCENSVVKSEVRFHEKSMLAKIRLLRGCESVRALAFVNA